MLGLTPELTGRENVYLNGALLGFDRKQVDNMYSEIVDFAELHEFMDQKLKNYSSGMQVRLAFSVAIRANTDILLVDEVLAVGDAAFQTKCFEYFAQLKKEGTTVVFVSHDRGSLERFCDRGVLIDKGVLIEEGAITDVLKRYSKIVMEELESSDNEQSHRERVSTPYVSISNVVACDGSRNSSKQFNFGEKIYIEYVTDILKKITNPIFGVTVWQRGLDRPLFATNTFIDGEHETGTFLAGDRVSFRTVLPTGLNDGEYYVEPAIANESATVFYEQQPRAAVFSVSGSENPYAIFSPPDHNELKKLAANRSE